jgi:hypothetical protein
MQNPPIRPCTWACNKQICREKTKREREISYTSSIQSFSCSFETQYPVLTQYEPNQTNLLHPFLSYPISQIQKIYIPKQCATHPENALKEQQTGHMQNKTTEEVETKRPKASKYGTRKKIKIQRLQPHQLKTHIANHRCNTRTNKLYKMQYKQCSSLT